MDCCRKLANQTYDSAIKIAQTEYAGKIALANQQCDCCLSKAEMRKNQTNELIQLQKEKALVEYTCCQERS